jgi:hypothetical protein
MAQIPELLNPSPELVNALESMGYTLERSTSTGMPVLVDRAALMGAQATAEPSTQQRPLVSEESARLRHEEMEALQRQVEEEIRMVLGGRVPDEAWDDPGRQ